MLSFDGAEPRVAIFEDGRLVEVYIERPLSQRIVGNVYKGRVQNVLPGMQAAFVDIGLERNAFLFVDDAYPPSAEGSEVSEVAEDLADAADAAARRPRARKPSIKDLVREGQEVMVQIAKEPIGTKGARVTRHVTLPGRYLVLMPTVDYVGVSRRISDEAERERLKDIAQRVRNRGLGFIVRTVAHGRSEAEIREDADSLRRAWTALKAKAAKARAPALLYKDLGLVQRIMRDQLTPDVRRILVDSPEEYARLQEYLAGFAPEGKPLVTLYTPPQGSGGAGGGWGGGGGGGAAGGGGDHGSGGDHGGGGGDQGGVAGAATGAAAGGGGDHAGAGGARAGTGGAEGSDRDAARASTDDTATMPAVRAATREVAGGATGPGRPAAGSGGGATGAAAGGAAGGAEAAAGGAGAAAKGVAGTARRGVGGSAASTGGSAASAGGSAASAGASARGARGTAATARAAGGNGATSADVRGGKGAVPAAAGPTAADRVSAGAGPAAPGPTAADRGSAAAGPGAADRESAAADSAAPDVAASPTAGPGAAIAPGLGLFAAWGVDEEIERALGRRVWLPAGGYLVIDQMEALTAIDVNTGKFIGSTDLADTVFRTNLEACAEIARQLRLRDIGGIIIIDFIDMDVPEHRRRVVAALEEACRPDHSRPVVLGLTQLGLVEMTRKKGRQSLRDLLTHSCPYCDGRGRVLTEESSSRRVRAEIRRILAGTRAEAVLVEVHPSVAALLIGAGGANLKELERELGHTIFVRGAEEIHVEKMNVRAIGTRAEVEALARPVREGEVIELRVEEPHVTNTSDGIARVEGYVIDIEGAGRRVGERVRVEITRAFRTYARGRMV